MKTRLYELIDSHCHLDAAEFDADRADVLSRARAAGITRQVVPAVGVAGFEALRRLCSDTAGLYPAYGLHPMFLASHKTGDLNTLHGWLERERPVAVGECGLDLFMPGLDRDDQQRYFHGQLELAREFELPVIVHARKALDPVTAAIRRSGVRHGVVHSFSGSPQQAAQLWKLGFCVGIGGPVTYDRAHRLRGIVATMPLEFLLLETDSPDQPPAGHQGQRNEPSQLTRICETVATLRGVESQAVAEATTRNAERLFGLDRLRSMHSPLPDCAQ